MIYINKLDLLYYSVLYLFCITVLLFLSYVQMDGAQIKENKLKNTILRKLKKKNVNNIQQFKLFDNIFDICYSIRFFKHILMTIDIKYYNLQEYVIKRTSLKWTYSLLPCRIINISYCLSVYQMPLCNYYYMYLQYSIVKFLIYCVRKIIFSKTLLSPQTIISHTIRCINTLYLFTEMFEQSYSYYQSCILYIYFVLMGFTKKNK